MKNTLLVLSLIASLNVFAQETDSLAESFEKFESKLMKEIFSFSTYIISPKKQQALLDIQKSYLSGDRELILLALLSKLESVSNKEEDVYKKTNLLAEQIEKIIIDTINRKIAIGFEVKDAIDVTYIDAINSFPKGYDIRFKGLRSFVAEVFKKIREESVLNNYFDFNFSPKNLSVYDFDQVLMLSDNVFKLNELDKSFLLLLKDKMISPDRQIEGPSLNRSGFVSPFWDELSKKVNRKPSYPRRELHNEVGTFLVEEFSSNVKFSFLGSEISAGPIFTFKRSYAGSVKLMAHGEDIPILNNEGLLNHSEDRRIFVLCSITSKSSNDLEVDGSFKLFNLGGAFTKGTSGHVAVKQSVMFKAPFTNEVGGKTNLKDLVKFCTKDYFKAIKKSLDFELQLGISQLVCKRKRTQCVKNSDCMGWFKKLSIKSRKVSTPVCVTETENDLPINRCKLRASKGGPCSFYQGDEKVTDSVFERPCVEGLKCKLVRRKRWFLPAKAYCF